MSGPLKYLVIKNTIKEQLLSGVLKYGDKVPSEAELCEQYDVSRISAKRALDELAYEGYIVRQRGRGSFVSYAPIEHLIDGIYSLKDELQKKGVSYHTELLDFKEIHVENADPMDEVGLHRYMFLEKTDRVYYIQCLRYADDVAIATDKVYIPIKYCPSITGEDIKGDGSIYRIIEEKYQYGKIRAQEHYYARTANPQEAELLKIATGSPVLKILRVSYAQGKPMIYSFRVYKGEILHLSVNLDYKEES